MNREKTLSDQLMGLMVQKANIAGTGDRENRFDQLIADCQGKLDETSEMLEEHEANHVTATQDSTEAYVTSMKISNMTSHFKNVTKFLPGTNTEVWLDELDRLFNVHIEPELNDYPSLEDQFVRTCKTHLDKVIFTQMRNSKEIINSYEDFRAYMIKAHGSRKSVFAALQKPFDLKMEEGEKGVTTFASKMDKLMREAQLRIKEKFKADHNTDMTADDVFSVMSSMLVSEQLRIQKPVIYGLITKRLDRMWSPIEISQEAQTYVDRGVGQEDEDDAFQVKAGATGKKGQKGQSKKSTGSSNSRTEAYLSARRNGECFKFKMNKPCVHNPCPFKHVDKNGREVAKVVSRPSANGRPEGNTVRSNVVYDYADAAGAHDYSAHTIQAFDMFTPVNFQ